MAQLEIKGHETRGSEVIALLEMLGGINSHNLYGDESYAYYTIDSDKEIKGSIYMFVDEDLLSFSLEQFEEQFPYKVGDKVTHNMGILMNIVHMYWDAECNVIRYDIQSPVDNNYKLKAMLAEHLQPYKEETMEERKYSDLRLDVDQDDKLATEATIDGNKITPPKNYLIGKITKVDNGMLVEFVQKQPKYPKTYVECCEILKVIHCEWSGYLGEVLVPFQKLLVCRYAYWKIAGDWKFDFDKSCFYLCNEYGSVQKFEGIIDCNAILAFPTEEMRDVFYENFKDLIEQCKELL